jgi:hypothetical protein
MQIRESVFQKFLNGGHCTPAVVNYLIRGLDDYQREFVLVAQWNYLVHKCYDMNVIEHVTRLLKLSKEELECAANEISERRPLMTARFCEIFFDKEFAEEMLVRLIQKSERDPYHKEDRIFLTLQGQLREVRRKINSEKMRKQESVYSI